MATIHLQSGKNTIKCNSKAKVQSVPFRIHADCDAKVKEYFDDYVKTEENNVLTASFRGYPLKGKDVKLPEDYVGAVFYESMPPLRDVDERKFYLIYNFNSITYWNWDKIPSKNDAFLQALDWIDISEALHAPIIEE